MRYYTLAASALITTVGIGIGVANLTIGLVDQAIAFSWPVLSLGVIMAMITPELKASSIERLDLE